MAQYQAGYGDQMRKTDEYGNPLQHTGGITGAGGHPTQIVEHDRKQEHGIGATLQRSNSSSSSSEDDGEGGRRKKGLKDKLMEKLPGGKKEEQEEAHSIDASSFPYVEGEQHEKKGFIEKIKDSLPGSH